MIYRHLLVAIGFYLPLVQVLFIVFGGARGDYFLYEGINESFLIFFVLYGGSASIILYSLYIKALPIDSALTSRAFERYGSILFWFSVLGLSILIINNLVNGTSPSNVVSQRGTASLLFGYFARLFSSCVVVYLLLAFAACRKFNVGIFIIILFQLVYFVSSESRFGLLWLASVLLFGVSFFNLRMGKKGIILIFIGLFSVLLGSYFRSNDAFLVLINIFKRLFSGQLAIVLAYENPTEFRSFIFEGNPYLIISHALAPLVDRVGMSTSLRLPEYWGVDPLANTSGHIAGYSFGWLGLSYASFNWFGLAFIAVVFWGLKRLVQLPGNRYLMRFFVYAFVCLSSLEFIGNFGWENFIDKSFKLAIFMTASYFMVLGLSQISRGVVKKL